MSYKSKDFMEKSGDKNNDLFQVSKRIEFIRPKQGKTSNDVEFEN